MLALKIRLDYTRNSNIKIPQDFNYIADNLYITWRSF